MDENSATTEESADNTANESVEVEETVQTEENDHLTPEIATNVEKFGSMSDTERTAYLEKLNKGGRKEAVNAIKDVYGIEDEYSDPQGKYTPEQLSEMETVFREKKRKEVAQNWVKGREAKLDLDKTLTSKTFLKHYHSDELSKLPEEARTELALGRTVDRKSLPDEEKREQAKTYTGKVTAKTKDSVNPDSFISLAMNSRG